MNAYELAGLHPVCADDAALVLGGIDKKAQDALYTIGYIVGIVVKFIVALFTFEKKQA